MVNDTRGYGIGQVGIADFDPPSVEDRLRDETIEEHVPVKLIFIDPRYGRPLNQKHIEYLSSNWNRAAAGILYLSFRSSGMYASLDGAHRRFACEEVEGPDSTLPALVFIDLTLEQEAELFLYFNRNRKNPKPGDIFRAEIGSGDLEALAIHKVVEQNGFHVQLTPGKHAWNYISAISRIKHIYNDLGPAGLSEVLAILKAAWAEQKGCVDLLSLGGVASFWVRYNEQMDRSHLITVMKRKQPEDLFKGVGAFVTLGIKDDHPNLAGRVLQGWYNSGQWKGNTSNLPEWPRAVMGPQARVRRQERYRTPVVAEIEEFLIQHPGETATGVAVGIHHSRTTIAAILMDYPQFRGHKVGHTATIKYYLDKK